MASSKFDRTAVAEVLSGTARYDDLGDREQALVREAWSGRIRARRASLDYAALFESRAASYSEADQDGNVIVRSFPR